MLGRALRKKTKRRSILLILALAAAAAPARAADVPRVAVNAFTGPFAGPIRQGVLSALEGKVELTGFAGAQAIVDGEVGTGGKRKYVLRLTVRGKGDRRYALAKAEVDPSTKDQIETDVLALILGPTTTAPPVAPQSAAPAARPAGLDDEPPRAALEPRVEQRAPEHVPKGWPDDPYRPYRVALSYSLEARSLEIRGDAGANLPRYDSAYLPTLGLGAEVMPGELLDGSEDVRALGLRLQYARALPSESKIAATGESVATSSTRLSVGPFYRVLVGNRARPTIVRPGIGYGRRSFDIGGATSPLPQTTYNYVQAGADLELPLFWRFSATGKLTINIGTGQAGLERFARDVGSNGADLGLGVLVRLPWNLELSAAMQYSYFALSFEGAPVVAGGAALPVPPQPGQPAPAAGLAHEGSDGFFAWVFGLGYAL